MTYQHKGCWSRNLVRLTCSPADQGGCQSRHGLTGRDFEGRHSASQKRKVLKASKELISIYCLFICTRSGRILYRDGHEQPGFSNIALHLYLITYTYIVKYTNTELDHWPIYLVILVGKHSPGWLPKVFPCWLYKLVLSGNWKTNGHGSLCTQNKQGVVLMELC